MMGPVVRNLILKDWRLHRLHVLISLAACGGSLAIVGIGNEAASFIGITLLFVQLIVLGSMLPVFNVINERKKQSLAFLMSLPLSALQYGVTKMVSTFGMFLAPWGLTALAGWIFVLCRHDIRNGILPIMFILFGLPLIGFCLIAGAALISESEGWTTAATIVSNSSYGLISYFLFRNPSINGSFNSPFAVWSRPVVTILTTEAAAVALILGITLYLQSRKREFV